MTYVNADAAAVLLLRWKTWKSSKDLPILQAHFQARTLSETSRKSGN